MCPPKQTQYLFILQMQVYMYNSDDFDSLSAALREKRIIAAMAVFFQVGTFFTQKWMSKGKSKTLRFMPVYFQIISFEFLP